MQLEEQFKPLEDDGQFYYLDICKKFIAKELMGQEIFEPEKPKYSPNTLTYPRNRKKT